MAPKSAAGKLSPAAAKLSQPPASKETAQERHRPLSNGEMHSTQRHGQSATP
ncbi:hypothetical protein OH492_03930 [Vibrio chagasii]|nr:hypothetical protein [Vibrio chagasii]